MVRSPPGRFYQDTLDYKKLVQTGRSSIPPDSLELYESFFDDDLPDVSIYASPKAGDAKSGYVSFAAAALGVGSPPTSLSSSGASSSTDLVGASVFSAGGSDGAAATAVPYAPKPRKVIGPRGVRIGECDLVSVGALYKLDGGRDQDFILFNEAAAEHSFGEMMRSEADVVFGKQ